MFVNSSSAQVSTYKSKVIGSWNFDGEFLFAMLQKKNDKANREKLSGSARAYISVFNKGKMSFTSSMRCTQYNPTKSMTSSGTYTITGDQLSCSILNKVLKYTILYVDDHVLILSGDKGILRLTK